MGKFLAVWQVRNFQKHGARQRKLGSVYRCHFLSNPHSGLRGSSLKVGFRRVGPTRWRGGILLFAKTSRRHVGRPPLSAKTQCRDAGTLPLHLGSHRRRGMHAYTRDSCLRESICERRIFTAKRQALRPENQNSRLPSRLRARKF